MPYITGALAGTANKQLCGLAIQADLNPVGLSLADGKMCIGSVLNAELGRVGSVVAGDPMLLQLLVSNELLPIISSIGADSDGRLLNINADQAATVIAQLLNAELILLSDVPGVLDANRTLIEKLNQHEINELIKQGVIRDGMVVKVQAALTAAESLGRSVTIASWKTASKLLGFLHNEPVGTRISPDSPSA
jgi:acetylglutamate kinase